MSLFISWLVFPLLFALLCLGCGLLAERIAGVRLNGLLLIPLGLAVVVVAAQIATNWDATAELATPLVVALALAGLVLARTRLRSLGIDRAATAAAVAVFAVFAAPVVLSGEATFAGYNLNGEPSIHFLGIDRMMEHGRSMAGLPPSSYEYCLTAFFGSGYPSAAQTALGSARPLVGQDVAWVFQPYFAFLVAMIALSLYAIVTPLVRRPLHRALVVFVAAQPALLYAYTLEGSLKEVAALSVITLLVALVIQFVKDPARARSVVPLAVASAAGIGVINIGIAPWLGLILLVCAALAVRSRPGPSWRPIAIQALAFVAITAVLAYPPLSNADTLYNTANEQLTAQDEVTAAKGLGNLVGPLKKAQAAGIWLNGDFRFAPTGTHHDITYLLIAIAIASALIGALWIVRRRAMGPLLYLGVSLIAAAFVIRRGSPWADAKALMITSPAVLLTAMLGASAFVERGGRAARIIGVGLGGVIALGVLWSNALQYHDVNLAPRDRLEQLERVGHRIENQGPTVYFEFEEYGKHFLRDAAPEGRTDACERRFFKQRDGQYPQYGFSAEPDQQTLRYITYFKTVVLRRSPAISRPPSIYRLTYANDYYEVWQRPQRPRQRIVEHLPLEAPFSPSGRPSCKTVERMAALARRERGRIAYVPRPAPTVWIPADSILPRGWGKDPIEAHVLIPNGPGRVQDSVRLPASDDYGLWLGGSFGRGVDVSVDGRRVGEVSYALNGRDQFEWVSDMRLAPGKHMITLLRGGGDMHPGNGGEIRALGPFVLEPRAARARPVRYLDPTGARSLCGRDLDWIEVVRS